MADDDGRRFALLAKPTLGFALAVTVATTYLPVVVAGQAGSATAVAALIAVEGVLALFLPLLVGARSDRLRTRLGGRLPFMLAGVPVMAAALVLLGFVGGFASALVVITVMFAAYYVAYEPYRALYPDLFSDVQAGRSQSAQAVARGLGTAGALVGGGLLLALGQPVPFVAAAGVLVATTALFVYGIRRRGEDLRTPPAEGAGVGEALGRLRDLVRERPDLRRFFIANALWEGALGAIRTFVVLWTTVTVGLSLTQSSLVIGLAGLFVLVGAGAAGRLADRFGTRRVLPVSAVAYGAPMAVAVLSTQPALLLPAMPVIAASAGVLMALPYAMLIPMMPAADHGLLTGFYSASRGVGIIVGPLLAGAAIEGLRALGDPLGPGSYSALWAIAGVLLLMSVPFVRRIDRESAGVAVR